MNKKFLFVQFLKMRDKSVLCILCPVPRVLCPPGHGDPGFLGGGRGSWGRNGGKRGNYGNGVAETEKGVDSRNSRDVPKSDSGKPVLKTESGKRIPNFGKCLIAIKVRESINIGRRQIRAKRII